MTLISLDEANNFLAKDPDIAILRGFAQSDLQDDPCFDVIAIEANAFKDEIKIYSAITEKMGLTPHMFPYRVGWRQPEAIKRQAELVIAGDYIGVNSESSWPKVESISREYTSALLRFIIPDSKDDSKRRMAFSAFTSHLFDDEYAFKAMDDLTPSTFNCGLFVFGYKETSPGEGFTYALGLSGTGED
jgi:hypothetical protein